MGKLRDAISRLGTYTYSFTFLSEAVRLNLDSRHSELPSLRTTYSPWLEATFKKIWGFSQCFESQPVSRVNTGVHVLLTWSPVDTLLMELAQESNPETSLLLDSKFQTRIVQKKEN